MTLVTETVAAPKRQASSPVVVRNTPGEWLAAALFCAACFQLWWTYHDLCRNKPYSLGTANECFALAGAYAVGAAVALGPLHRLTGRLRRTLRLRRPLGVAGGACALIHALLSLTVRWEPLESAGQAACVLLGFVTLLLFALLVATSWPRALRRLGRQGWRRVQSKAPLLLLLVMAHFLVLGKISGWVAWFRTFGQPDHLPGPAATLFVFLFAVAVFALRGISWRVGAATLLVLAFLAAGLLPAAGAGQEAPTLEVLCGPALRPAASEVFRAFEKRSGARVQVSYDASGALLGQLRLRPHGDVLLPGDRSYTDEAIARGLAESPAVVALFRPVILVRKGNPRGIRSLSDLAKPGVRVGIGEERATAIGKTTLALLERNHLAVERVPIVYRAAKIDELANAVRLGSIDAAIVWDAVARVYRSRTEAVPIPAERSVTVPVAAAIISSSKRKALAAQLLAFFRSKEGRAILKKHRYSVP